MNIDDATFVEDLRRPLSKDSWLPAIRFGDGIAELNAIRARAADIIERLTSSPTPSYPGLPDNSAAGEMTAEQLRELNEFDVGDPSTWPEAETITAAAALIRHQASALAGARTAALEEAAALCKASVVHNFSPNLSQYVIFPGVIDRIRALGSPAEKEK